MPKSSSDMAEGEKAWANIKDSVYRDNSPYTTKEEHAPKVRAAWLEVLTTEDHKRRLAGEAREACKQCIKKRGYEVH